MKVFWFLDNYSLRPDGSTVMINQHHKELIKNNIESYIVFDQEIEWLKVDNKISMYDSIKKIEEDDILLTSWDNKLNNILKFKKGKKIAYLQSHFANSDQRYKLNIPLVTVSNFAKEYIQTKYKRQRYVLNNIVAVQQQYIEFAKKKDIIYCSHPRRDLDILKAFSNNTAKQIKIEEFCDRQKFLNNLNNSKFFLSHYREDAFGLPPIEAMSMGTIPIIFTNSTGRDYRQHMKNCLIFKPQEAKDWNDSILNEIDNRKLLQMSANGVWTRRKYRQSKIMQLLKELKC